MSVLVGLLALCAASIGSANTPVYHPRGVGGGGAMAGFSISPYSDLRFVGTDMGTLFRSTDKGASWMPVSHYQARFDSNLEHSSYVGFSSDPNVVFHASAGRTPKRSTDGGLTWAPIEMKLQPEERVLYWVGDSTDPLFILAGTTKGLLRSVDKGSSWQRVSDFAAEAKGTFIQYPGIRTTIYHATATGIFVSLDHAKTFTLWHKPEGVRIRSFAGGADERGVTLSFVDNNGVEACAWAENAFEAQEHEKIGTMADCGFVWVSRGNQSASKEFERNSKEAGRYLRMAENDSRSIYVTGGAWVRQYGTKVWVSRDAGQSWNLALHQYNWDTNPYSPWPRSKLEYSAVALDVGWDDSFYTSFAINSRNAAEAGGTGYYFLLNTYDGGQTWKSPFTRYADTGEPSKGKRWASVGLEMTSVLKLKFHPRNPKLGYASLSDMGGLITEDGGRTWRISKVKWNTNYDYAFDPESEDTVFAVSGNAHDFPLNGWGNVIDDSGGVYRSDDRGRTWRPLTPDLSEWNRQFLSLAFDPVHRVLYAGTQGGGIGRSTDYGKTWQFINEGLPAGGKIVPQIETDPKNGNVYLLLSGDAPSFTNQKFTGIYFLDVNAAGSKWELLRAKVHPASDMPSTYKLWWYPTSFAVDFTRPARDVLYLTDMETQGEWLGSGVWKTTDRGANWHRATQYTHPTSIVIDPVDSNVIYAGGSYHADGSWGLGGAMYSLDGGKSWQRNEALPLVANLYGMRPDPSHPGRIFYLYFGGGMLYGPKPR